MNKKEAQNFVDELADIKEVLEREHKESIQRIDALQDLLLNVIHPVEKGYIRFRTLNGYVSFKAKGYRSKLRKGDGKGW